MTAKSPPSRVKPSSRRRNSDALLEAEALIRHSEVSDTPRLEAEVLLADLLAIDRAKLIASYAQPIEISPEFFSRVRRRTQGEPIAYITGVKEFMGRVFNVDKRALIPRPETETLVELVVEAFPSDTKATIVDIGTGCGCIAVSLALALPRSSLHAVDISTDALELARENAERQGVNRRITFHDGDTCSALPRSLEAKVDAIVSNPPYITDAEYAALDPGITDFEPSFALRGGADGLEVFRSIAAGAARCLAPDGLLAVEIGSDQAGRAADILAQTGFFREIKTATDLSGRERIVTGRKTL